MLIIDLLLIGLAMAQESKPISTEILVAITDQPISEFTVPSVNGIVFTHEGKTIIVPTCPFGCPDFSKSQPQPAAEEAPVPAALPTPTATLHLRHIWTTPCSPKKNGCEVKCAATFDNGAWQLEGNTVHQDMCLNGGYAPSEILK